MPPVHWALGLLRVPGSPSPDGLRSQMAAAGACACCGPRPLPIANPCPLLLVAAVLLVVGVGTAGVVRGEMRNVRWCLAQDRRFSLPPEP
jgi:hypothetical protein